MLPSRSVAGRVPSSAGGWSHRTAAAEEEEEEAAGGGEKGRAKIERVPSDARSARRPPGLRTTSLQTNTDFACLKKTSEGLCSLPGVLFPSAPTLAATRGPTRLFTDP